MTRIIPINLFAVYAYLVIVENGGVIVDSGFPGQEGRIMKAIQKAGLSKHDIKLIVITHSDIDHYGSADKLRLMLDAPVLVHKADSDIIRTGVNRKIKATGLAGFLKKQMASFLTALTKRRYKPFEPDLIMDSETLDLKKYGIDAYLLHTPGETAGSISLILKNKTVIVGDLFGSTVPHGSHPAYSPFPSDLDEVKTSLKKVLALRPDFIYTGHSAVIDVKKAESALIELAK